jgi:Ca2+-transporting ATPase
LALLRQGTVLAAAALGSLVVGNYLMDLAWDVTRTMVFTTLVIVQLAHAYSVRARATGRIGGGPGRNRVLMVGVATSGVLHLGVVYTPLGQTLFDTVGLPAAAWPIMLAVTAASFLAVNLMNAATAARRPVSRR